ARGNTIDAEYDELKGKTIAVVCRPPLSARYGPGNAGNDIAQELGFLLKQKVRRVKIIDPALIAQWTDEHEWDEFSEIGEALGADVVVGIDLEKFDLYRGQTLYQGQ